LKFSESVIFDSTSITHILILLNYLYQEENDTSREYIQPLYKLIVKFLK